MDTLSDSNHYSFCNDLFLDNKMYAIKYQNKTNFLRNPYGWVISYRYDCNYFLLI